MIANAGLLATSPWIADMVGRFSIEHYAGAGCTTPPTGAKFYPFWTLGHAGRLGCVWNFGNVIPSQTTRTFGGDAQYLALAAEPARLKPGGTS